MRFISSSKKKMWGRCTSVRIVLTVNQYKIPLVLKYVLDETDCPFISGYTCIGMSLAAATITGTVVVVVEEKENDALLFRSNNNNINHNRNAEFRSVALIVNEQKRFPFLCSPASCITIIVESYC
jgi:hypothetical protein